MVSGFTRSKSGRTGIGKSRRIEPDGRFGFNIAGDDVIPAQITRYVRQRTELPGALVYACLDVSFSKRHASKGYTAALTVMHSG